MLTPWPAIARPPGLSPLQEPGAGGGAGGAAAAPEGGHPGDGRAAHLAPAPAQAARAGRQAGLLGTAPAARGQAAGRPCRCAGHECVWVRWEGQGRQQQHAAATQLPAATNSAHSPLPPCSLGVAGGPAADGAELPHPGAAAVERAARLLQLAAGRAHRLSGLRAGGAQAVPLLQLQQLLAFATISMCWRICSIAAQHLTLHPAAALVVLQELAAAMQNREDLRPAVCSALVRLCLQARQVSWRAGGGATVAQAYAHPCWKQLLQCWRRQGAHRPRCVCSPRYCRCWRRPVAPTSSDLLPRWWAAWAVRRAAATRRMTTTSRSRVSRPGGPRAPAHRQRRTDLHGSLAPACSPVVWCTGQ